MHERHTPPTHRPLCWSGRALISPQHTSHKSWSSSKCKWKKAKKNTHAQFFQICMSSSYGSFTSLSTGSGQNTCKHLVTQAFNLHSVLTLMTSKCGLDCGTEYESSDCLCPSEFYMGLSPQPRGSSTIAGKGWIYPTGPVRMLTSFSFFLGNSLLFTEPFTKGF